MTDETIDIEALEVVKHHPYYLAPGDVKRSVPVDDAQYMIDHGWCRNLETGEVGEREGGPVDLDIHSSKLGVQDSYEE